MQEQNARELNIICGYLLQFLRNHLQDIGIVAQATIIKSRGIDKEYFAAVNLALEYLGLFGACGL